MSDKTTSLVMPACLYVPRGVVVDAAKEWREAKCIKERYPDICVGDNHLEYCPCEIARQNLIAALNKLDMEEKQIGYIDPLLSLKDANGPQRGNNR